MSHSLDGSVSNSRAIYDSGVTGSAYPVTISCWCYCTNGIVASGTPGMNIAAVSSTDKNTVHSVQFVTATTNSNTRVRCSSVVNNGSPASAQVALGNLANKWIFAAGVFRNATSTNSRSAYCNNLRSNNNTARSPTNINDLVAGATCANAAVRHFEGYIAELGVWNASLNDSDIAALYAGAKPTSVKPDNLVHYVPFIQTANDVVAGIPPQVQQGLTAASDHPRRYG